MDKKRFAIIEKQGKLQQFQVIRDNETGVLYMSQAQGYGLGMTVLFDVEGKPLVDQEYVRSGKYTM
ncbi:hypothetical protein CSV71_11350 [Sporosarcina sp. P21c]|uniref:DUF6440 family protein n=1 Tax=unclassified Sporosarcina TaxID=2647733 RepID=UPI000C172D78|nr:MULTISPECIES: DUF6440 family protein [unclassified Sporosarcina]PIC67538.1 hypothetical protein CSV78_06420 [Sporosarcina sp. P16a]PIC89135.1 hypothetical protein CSV71_11350 [Sporosarcina sp. P21c]PIC92989.1 hypothetical protein CSV70_07170 [Sporosarcina sp. P25]